MGSGPHIDWQTVPDAMRTQLKAIRQMAACWLVAASAKTITPGKSASGTTIFIGLLRHVSVSDLLTGITKVSRNIITFPITNGTIHHHE